MTVQFRGEDFKGVSSEATMPVDASTSTRPVPSNTLQLHDIVTAAIRGSPEVGERWYGSNYNDQFAFRLLFDPSQLVLATLQPSIRDAARELLNRDHMVFTLTATRVVVKAAAIDILLPEDISQPETIKPRKRVQIALPPAEPVGVLPPPRKLDSKRKHREPEPGFAPKRVQITTEAPVAAPVAAPLPAPPPRQLDLKRKHREPEPGFAPKREQIATESPATVPKSPPKIPRPAGGEAGGAGGAGAGGKSSPADALQFVGGGAYGCVYTGLDCPGQPPAAPGFGTVGKAVGAKNQVKELTAAKMVRDADPTGTYSGVLLAACKLPPQMQDYKGDACTKAVKPSWLLTFVNVGVPIVRYVRDRRPTPPQFAATTATLVRALDYFHRRAVYHYDLNDGNVLVDPATGMGRLIDFGGLAFLQFKLAKYNYLMHWSHSPVDMMVLCRNTGRALIGAEDGSFESMAKLFTGTMTAWFSSPTRNTPPLVMERVLMVNSQPLVKDILMANDAYVEKQKRSGAFNAKTPAWPALDVFGLGTTLLVALQALVESPGAAADPMTAALLELATDMVQPVTASRPTAAQVWAAVQALCARFGVPIPPPQPTVVPS